MKEGKQKRLELRYKARYNKKGILLSIIKYNRLEANYEAFLKGSKGRKKKQGSKGRIYIPCQ